MSHRTMTKNKHYYLVLSNIDRAPLRDYLLHGYETRRNFEQALYRLVSQWRGRTGECIDERHGFRLLRFHDTPGGKPDEEWLPVYLLQPVPPPPPDSSDSAEELDQAYEFT